ncbi:MAG: phosphoribosylformylglycinamidine cyclo-ligase [Chloroflexota bacterium]|jgi:phosphoribosylformylglycinamidine cyclo-ligase|nr:phosphoribosylformylglycinamidine cyclo-ligase [Chloroflexota bacterium]
MTLDYGTAGVDTTGVERGLSRLVRLIAQTHEFGPSRTLLPIGYYANVVEVAPGIGVAISTDGVGTKLLVAEMLGRYDTVGIDCVAMNVNDILCVGAEPTALVDYIALDVANPDVLEALARGLLEGARQANVSIPGGEIAQVPEMIRGHGDAVAIDLVGTAIGLVDPARLITGAGLADGDVVLGLASSGIHSNGLTLARRVLLGAGTDALAEQLPGTSRTVGDDLLEPTRIYVAPIVRLLKSELPVRALFHITGDGFLNLLRTHDPVSFELDALPPVPSIMRLIRERGNIALAEMYRVFNMGVGFCVVMPPTAAETAQALIIEAGFACQRIGVVRTDGRREVRLPELGLVGTKAGFRRA